MGGGAAGGAKGMNGPFWEAVWVLLGAMVFQGLATGTLVFAAVGFLQGKRPGVGKSLAVGWKRLLPVLFTSLLIVGFVAIGTLLFVIPGVIVLVMLYLALPVTVLERKGGMEALSRSAKLTSGHKMSIFLALLPLGILSSVLYALWGHLGLGLIDGILGRASSFGESRLHFVLFVLGREGLDVLLAPFYAALSAFAYVRLREIKDGVRLKELVKVFR